MGNTCCAGQCFSKNGCFQSISTTKCSTRSPETQPQLSIQYKPPEQKNIPEPEKKQEQQPPLSIQYKPPEQTNIPEPVNKQEQQPPLSAQHTPHEPTKIPEPEKKQEQQLAEPKKMKRAIDSILQKKTGNLEDLFTLGEKLGQGRFGTVFLCIDKSNGERYACKSIMKSKLLTNDDVEDVRREIQIMHLLVEHPNVITIKGEYEDDVAIYIVMELCVGGELFDRITKRGRYTERKVAELTRTIVGVVEACHSLGVMHRDLKPENFLLMNDREDAALKAIDFGLSVFFKPGESFHRMVGSPYYVAPEVLKKKYGPEVDVWSAGVIVYILLCGVPPFWAETQEGIFEQVLHGDLDLSSGPWSSISDGAKDLLRRMLDRDPKRRLIAHEVLCHPWVQVNGETPHKPLDSPSHMKQFSSMDNLKNMAIITSQMADVDGNGTIDGGEFVAETLHINETEKENHLFLACSYFGKTRSVYYN